MEYILRRIHKAGIFGCLYVMSLLNAFNFFGVHFINSSFLEEHISRTTVGIVFAISSFLTLISLAVITIILERFGAYRIALLTTSANLTATYGLSQTNALQWILVLFTLQSLTSILTIFCFDLFLENYTKDEQTTGFFRGLFLSMSMVASLFSPVLSGWLIHTSGDFKLAYLVSALYLIPTLMLLIISFRKFSDPIYKTPSIKKTILHILQNKDLRNVSIAQFLLRFFFSWMVIYLPMFLSQHIGFSWTQIGIILFIMILPYIFIEFPAGIIADRFVGEKELLFAGFIITGISTIALFFLQSATMFYWGTLLFITRIGAALIESMSETYFFKKVDGTDANTLSVFRMLRPFAYIVGPLTGSALLMLYPIEFLWIVLGCIMILGTMSARALTDTR